MKLVEIDAEFRLCRLTIGLVMLNKKDIGVRNLKKSEILLKNSISLQNFRRMYRNLS